MSQSLQVLIESLRDELQNYGEMLALLERQKAHLIARAACEIFQSISLIKAQGAAIFGPAPTARNAGARRRGNAVNQTTALSPL